mmetsp:Transcript_12711/g.32394  ORF Transcript_12711/g.32394 Transcript_12711/m.32394 type:complete len:129 (-) Transcript_12711:144-530(-)
MDAMTVGLPTISTNWSGNLEYQTEQNSLLVRVDHLSEVPSDWFALGSGHRWAQPSLQHLMDRLREVYSLTCAQRERITSQAWIDLQSFREELVGEQLFNRLERIVEIVRAGEQDWDEAKEYFLRRRRR